jgi:hypothetical protein
MAREPNTALKALGIHATVKKQIYSIVGYQLAPVEARVTVNTGKPWPIKMMSEQQHS